MAVIFSLYMPEKIPEKQHFLEMMILSLVPNFPLPYLSFLNDLKYRLFFVTKVTFHDFVTKLHAINFVTKIIFLDFVTRILYY